MDVSTQKLQHKCLCGRGESCPSFGYSLTSTPGACLLRYLPTLNETGCSSTKNESMKSTTEQSLSSTEQRLDLLTHIRESISQAVDNLEYSYMRLSGSRSQLSPMAARIVQEGVRTELMQTLLKLLKLQQTLNDISRKY